MPINLGNPVEYSINELAALVIKLTGSSSPIVHQALPSDDPRCRRPDIRRAHEFLNWQPRTPIQAGLRATIASFSAANGRRPVVPLTPLNLLAAGGAVEAAR